MIDDPDDAEEIFSEIHDGLTTDQLASLAKRAGTRGVLACAGPSFCCYFWQDEQLVETGIQDHPEYEDIATVHGVPQTSDEEDEYQNDFLTFVVGRIGQHYFDRNVDDGTISYLGWYDDPEEAAVTSAGADFFHRML